MRIRINSTKPLSLLRLAQLASRDLSTSVQSQTSVHVYKSGPSELHVLMGVLTTYTQTVNGGPRYTYSDQNIVQRGPSSHSKHKVYFTIICLYLSQIIEC